jgi:hypothetical protein
MKSKFVFGLIATMVVLALAPSSFAQINIQIFTNGSAQEVDTNRTAQTADPLSAGAGILVSGALVANSPLTTTNLAVDYPANVTSGTSVLGADIPTSDPIRIEGQTGVFAGAVISTINYITGLVTIELPGTDDTSTPAIETNNQSGSFRLVGVRIDTNGLTAPVNATFSLSNTANNYILSTTSGPVINALGDGIGSMAVGGRTSSSVNSGVATIFTNRLVVDNMASFVVTEGFASAWRTAAQSTTNNTATANSTQVRLTFTGIPSGLSLPLAITDASGTLLSGGGITGLPGSVSSSSNVVTLSFSNTSLTAVEAFQVDIGPIPTPGSSVTLTAGAITVTATMAPIGTALSSTQFPTESTGFPKFAQEDVGPVTVVNIVSANTTLLVPFAVRDGGYDTGIALANTTADPFGSAGGGAAPSAGSIVLNFFPRTATGAGTSFSLTTSATVRPGIGLSTDGTLAAGSTWSVLLSELLTSAGQTGPFTGYIFIQTNFINAHGAPFVSDFRNFTSFSPMLVLPPPSTAPRTSPTGTQPIGGFESLNF